MEKPQEISLHIPLNDINMSMPQKNPNRRFTKYYSPSMRGSLLQVGAQPTKNPLDEFPSRIEQINQFVLGLTPKSGAYQTPSSRRNKISGNNGMRQSISKRTINKGAFKGSLSGRNSPKSSLDSSLLGKQQQQNHYEPSRFKKNHQSPDQQKNFTQNNPLSMLTKMEIQDVKIFQDWERIEYDSRPRGWRIISSLVSSKNKKSDIWQLVNKINEVKQQYQDIIMKAQENNNNHKKSKKVTSFAQAKKQLIQQGKILRFEADPPSLQINNELAPVRQQTNVSVNQNQSDNINYGKLGEKHQELIKLKEDAEQFLQEYQNECNKVKRIVNFSLVKQNHRNKQNIQKSKSPRKRTTRKLSQEEQNDNNDNKRKIYAKKINTIIESLELDYSQTDSPKHINNIQDKTLSLNQTVNLLSVQSPISSKKLSEQKLSIQLQLLSPINTNRVQKQNSFMENQDPLKVNPTPRVYLGRINEFESNVHKMTSDLRDQAQRLLLFKARQNSNSKIYFSDKDDSQDKQSNFHQNNITKETELRTSIDIFNKHGDHQEQHVDSSEEDTFHQRTMKHKVLSKTEAQNTPSDSPRNQEPMTSSAIFKKRKHEFLDSIINEIKQSHLKNKKFKIGFRQSNANVNNRLTDSFHRVSFDGNSNFKYQPDPKRTINTAQYCHKMAFLIRMRQNLQRQAERRNSLSPRMQMKRQYRPLSQSPLNESPQDLVNQVSWIQNVNKMRGQMQTQEIARPQQNKFFQRRLFSQENSQQREQRLKETYLNLSQSEIGDPVMVGKKNSKDDGNLRDLEFTNMTTRISATNSCYKKPFTNKLSIQ